MRYGFIGLGNLGVHLARNLAARGFALEVFDLQRASAQPVLDAGASWAESVEALAGRCDALITCLPSPAASRQVMARALPALNGGSCWIEMSTNDYAEVEKIVANLARMYPDALRYTKVALNHQKELLFREMTQAREWCTLHFPSMESRSGFGAFFHKKPLDSNPSWHAQDTGHNTVAPYGGYSVLCTSCGADHLPEDHKFCGVCGAGLTKPAIPTKAAA